jgi:hypothetical protein
VACRSATSRHRLVEEMSKPRRPATCHPERPNYGHGLCSACSYKKKKEEDPDKLRADARRRMRNWIERNPEKFKQSCTSFKTRNPEFVMLTRARARAKKNSLECTISREDIVIPETCPLLGIPLVKGEGKLTGNSPSLDRKDSTKGYVKGNVWVISNRANWIKSVVTFEEFRTIYENWKASLNDKG